MKLASLENENLAHDLGGILSWPYEIEGEDTLKSIFKERRT